MATSFLQRLRTLIEMLAAIAIIVVAVVFLWPKKTPPDPALNQTISLSGAFTKGDPAARVGIIEYGDFECSACIRFANHTFQQLLTKYIESGQVQFAFRHFPLPNHAMAKPAAIGAQCAGEQDKFWQFYLGIFGRPSQLDEGLLQSTVERLNLDPARWESCRVNQVAAEVVERDFSEARLLGLRATPAFLIGTINADGRLRSTGLLYGARPLTDFHFEIARAEKAAATRQYGTR